MPWRAGRQGLDGAARRRVVRGRVRIACTNQRVQLPTRNVQLCSTSWSLGSFRPGAHASGGRHRRLDTPTPYTLALIWRDEYLARMACCGHGQPFSWYGMETEGAHGLGQTAPFAPRAGNRPARRTM
jgi:hypothetical protein